MLESDPFIDLNALTFFGVHECRWSHRSCYLRGVVTSPKKNKTSQIPSRLVQEKAFLNQPPNPWGHIFGLHLARHEPLLVAAHHIGNLLLVHNPHCLLNADLRICSVPCRSALSTCLLLEPLEGHVKPDVRHEPSQCFLQWLLQVQQRQLPPVVDYTECPTPRSNNGDYILLCLSLTSLVRRA